MEDNRKAAERALRCSFEGHRLEEQLWAMAYECLWPVVRGSLKKRAELSQRREGTSSKTQIARRA